MTLSYLIITIIIGSLLSLLAGALLFTTKKRRDTALLLALPFAAGALLAAAFLDLLPESFELEDPAIMLIYALIGLTSFFVLERCASWFHHHHEHSDDHKNVRQRGLVVAGDVLHNAIDGIAVGAAFLVSIPTGVVTMLAVSAHEIPKELGTFALLLSRGWKDKKVLLANILTAIATLVAAVVVYVLGSDAHLPVGPLLAFTAGCFIYVAASDIIPDIHEQSRRIGTIQAIMLVAGLIIVGTLIQLLGV